jgi:polyisoprenoid-binding protein YceI
VPLPHPHTRRGWLITAAAGAAVMLAGGVAAVYLVLFDTSAPQKLTLSSGAAGSTASPEASQVSGSALAGTWKVGSGSVAGYRVREQLAFLSAPSDAVGRTSSISGSISLTGSSDSLSVTAASFTVDVSTLASDRSMRDDRIHSIGLESDRYPRASFVLTAPLSLPAKAATGAVVDVSATGKLTIHGVTRTETIPLQARVTGSEIEVVGSITFAWNDFGMTAPSIGGFVSVGSSATMEFDLHLAHA